VTFPSAEHFSGPEGTFSDAKTSKGDIGNSLDVSSEISLSEDENAESDPYPFSMDSNEAFGTWSGDFSGAKSWSSRPTTPSEISCDLDGKEIEMGMNYALTEYQSPEDYSTKIKTNTTNDPIGQELPKESQVVYWSIDEFDTSVVTEVDFESYSGEANLDHHHHYMEMAFNSSIADLPEPIIPPLQGTHMPLPTVYKNKPVRGRQRGLTALEKKQAREVREAKACWACHLLKTKVGFQITPTLCS